MRETKRRGFFDKVHDPVQVNELDEWWDLVKQSEWLCPVYMYSYVSTCDEGKAVCANCHGECDWDDYLCQGCR